MVRLHLVGGITVNSDTTFQGFENLLGAASKQGSERLLLGGSRNITVFIAHIVMIEEIQ